MLDNLKFFIINVIWYNCWYKILKVTLMVIKSHFASIAYSWILGTFESLWISSFLIHFEIWPMIHIHCILFIHDYFLMYFTFKIMVMYIVYRLGNNHFQYVKMCRKKSSCYSYNPNKFDWIIRPYFSTNLTLKTHF